MLSASSPGSEKDNKFKITGYWHNWQDQETGWLPLQELPTGYNRVIIAFAVPQEPWSGEMTFTPERGTKAEFREAVEALQDKETEVLVAIGGSRHPIALETKSQQDAFVESLSTIIHTYGFDGLDVNLEGHSMILDEDDSDFRAPTTPKIQNLITALQTIMKQHGDDFILTFAPETVYSTGGYHRYGEEFGGYLPVLHALRGELDAVHIQLYNSGSQYVFRESQDDLIAEQGTIDFAVGLSMMLAEGFPVERDSNAYFPGLGYDKVAPGFPAHPEAAPAGGFLPADVLCDALQKLKKRASLEGTAGSKLKGIMFWSLNWDAVPDDHDQTYRMMHAVQNCRDK